MLRVRYYDALKVDYHRLLSLDDQIALCNYCAGNLPSKADADDTPCDKCGVSADNVHTALIERANQLDALQRKTQLLVNDILDLASAVNLIQTVAAKGKK